MIFSNRPFTVDKRKVWHNRYRNGQNKEETVDVYFFGHAEVALGSPIVAAGEHLDAGVDDL